MCSKYRVAERIDTQGTLLETASGLDEQPLRTICIASSHKNQGIQTRMYVIARKLTNKVIMPVPVKSFQDVK